MAINATLTPRYKDKWNFDPFNLTWDNGTLTVRKTSPRKLTPALENLIELIETDSEFQFEGENADTKKLAKKLGLADDTGLRIQPDVSWHKIRNEIDFQSVLIDRQLGAYSVEFASS